MALVEKGELEEAKDYLIDVLRINSDDVWGLVVIANIYTKQAGSLNSAERFSKRAVSLDPQDPWALNSLAVIKNKKGEKDEAEILFRKILDIKPEFPNPYLGLSLLL